MEWKKARKKPIVIEFRDVKPNFLYLGNPCEKIGTLEGDLFGKPDVDFIIRGVEGEIYPIKKEIFNKTYDVL